MYILAIDQGTTGTTCCLVDKKGIIIDSAYKEITQHYPEPGWVEHDPEEIYQSVLFCVAELTKKHPNKVHAIGITNQRETTVVWNKITQKPVYNAIVWQCRRTASICNDLEEHAEVIREKTGLPLDPYFSATKVKWILDKQKNKTNLLFGTIDAWLLYKLTNGGVHATDYTNASRTMLFNIETREWDQKLCDLFSIPRQMLPEVHNSQHIFGNVTAISELQNIPIAGIAGDQQSALFGQFCFAKGQVKNTYGTGCFMLMNTGEEIIRSQHGLITTLAINSEGKPSYALEGAVFIGGAAIQWLRDEINLLDHAAQSEQLATEVEDTGGVYLVPAFVGLGAPHWDAEARGALVGLTRGTNKHHLIRATLESIAFQSHDILEVMEKDSGAAITHLAVDGGACANNFLMQFQADIAHISVDRPKQIESTSLGAAYLAGLEIEFFSSTDDLKQVDKTFTPDMPEEKRIELLAGWKRAMRQTMTK